MISLDQKLGELVSKMSASQKEKFFELRKKEMTQEALVNLAESCCVDELPSAGTGRKIVRNNGASSYAESDPRAESDRILMEALSKRDPELAKAIKETAAVDQLTESQRKEYEFCLMLHMSEADAMKVAKLS
jgi:hypothetical protein